MQCSRGLAIACVSIVILSALLLYLAYSLVEGQGFGIDSTEDAFFVIESIIFAGVAVGVGNGCRSLACTPFGDALLPSGLVVLSF